MDIKIFPGINKNINNIVKTAAPYWRLLNEPNSVADKDKKMVVIFGNDMSGMLDYGFCKKDSYVARFNQCIEYVRKNFAGCDLCYKPHPGDEQEKGALDLRDFRIIEEKNIAEMFLLESHHKIKALFSIGSYSTVNAYYMGLNAHAFYRCFLDVFWPEFIWSLDDLHFEMPSSFFINDLLQGVTDNSRTLKSDDRLIKKLKEHLSKNSGKVWLVCSFSDSLIILSSLAQIIKDIDPTRKTALIVNRNRRWDKINPDFINKFFDEIIFVPRINHSLRPGKLLKILKIAWDIKNFKIAKGDIFIVNTQPEFIENCLMSYYKDNLRIGFMTSRDFNCQYNNQNLSYTKNNDFRFNKATWFYNKILEPILGLHRTLWLAFTRGKGVYTNRYQEPVNQIFDELLLFSPDIMNPERSSPNGLNERGIE